MATPAISLRSAIESLGLHCELIQAVPFSDELPAVSADGLTVFYGATTLIQNVSRARAFTPGLFFDEVRFDFESLREHYKDHLLNADSEVTTVAALSTRGLRPDDYFFIRPAADGKEFTGTVMSGTELGDWLARVGGSDGALTVNSRIQLSTPRTIAREWRVFVVDGTPVAWSRYRTNFRLDPSPVVPSEVIEFAASMAKLYSPSEVFTLDVCEHEQSLRVIETNCFNSSGFYACDLRALVRAVSGFVLRRW